MSESNGTIPPAIPADREAERAWLERLEARSDIAEREIDDAREQIRALYKGETAWQQRVERSLLLVTNRCEEIYWLVVRQKVLLPALASFFGALLAAILVAVASWLWTGVKAHPQEGTWQPVSADDLAAAIRADAQDRTRSSPAHACRRGS